MRGLEIPVTGNISRARCSGYKDERGCGTFASYSGLLYLTELFGEGKMTRTAVRRCPTCNSSVIPQEAP